MPPKKVNNRSNPDKAAELKDSWANNLELKYEAVTYADRNDVAFFVQNLLSNIRSKSTRTKSDFDQIFGMFCLMALNALKTANNTSSSKQLGTKSSSKLNAVLGTSDLRHAICTHFENAVRNFHLVEEYNTVFLSHFDENKLPDAWDTYLTTRRTAEPEDLDEWMESKYPDKLQFQYADKMKIYFGHTIFECGVLAQKEIVNVFNPLWKPADIPSGKSIADMLRAIKIQRATAKYHFNAVGSMRKQDQYLSGEWHDPEKVDYVRRTVEAKLKAYDPDTKHPPYWLAFLMCSYPIDHFTNRRLALTSVVPPPRPMDNPAVLPGAGLRALERNSATSVAGTVDEFPKKIKSKKDAASAEASDNSSLAFQHTVKLVSEADEDRELNHLREKVKTIRDAIETLQRIDAEGFDTQIKDLQGQLAQAVIHQVNVMKLRTEQFNFRRKAQMDTDVLARDIVERANRKALEPLTPLTVDTNNDPESTQLLPQQQRKMHYALSDLHFVTAEAFDQEMHRRFGYVTKDTASWKLEQPNRAFLMQLADLREVVDTEDDYFMVDKWLRLIANFLDVDLYALGIWKRAAKRPRIDAQEDIIIVPDS